MEYLGSRVSSIVTVNTVSNTKVKSTVSYTTMTTAVSTFSSIKLEGTASNTKVKVLLLGGNKKKVRPVTL